MATITVRRISPTGDVNFGHGLNDFLSDAAAVTQLISMRMSLWKSWWWEDRSFGMPWLSILGGPINGPARAASSDFIRSQIARVPFVSKVQSVIVSGSGNSLTVSYSVLTPFGVISGSTDSTPAAIYQE